jgi:hypothetical protein
MEQQSKGHRGNQVNSIKAKRDVKQKIFIFDEIKILFFSRFSVQTFPVWSN